MITSCCSSMFIRFKARANSEPACALGTKGRPSRASCSPSASAMTSTPREPRPNGGAKPEHREWSWRGHPEQLAGLFSIYLLFSYFSQSKQLLSPFNLLRREALVRLSLIYQHSDTPKIALLRC